MAEKDETPTKMEDLIRSLVVDETIYSYYDITVLGEAYEKLPFCLRIIAECLLRNGLKDKTNGFVWKESLAKLLDYKSHASENILFRPGRVLLQDFTGVPALTDLAAIRDVVKEKGFDPDAIDSLCPADLVVDHTVQLDYSQIMASMKKKEVPKATGNNISAQTFLPSPRTIIMQSTFPPPINAQMMLPPPTFCDPQLVNFPPLYGQTVPVYHPQTYYPIAASDPVFSTNLNESCLEPHVSDVCPDDNPGLPIQDDICPFHQRLSFWCDVLRKSQENQFEQNSERFGLLKWVNHAFKNITVIPPGTGVMHQVNLEYLARIVTCQDKFLFPDSVIGTDSHTTMINGLGVLGWCVGTMEAESVIFGHPISFNIPKVIGCRISGSIPQFSTSTEIVLLVTKKLRNAEVTGCFVEFFGQGIQELSVADRQTIASMCPEYGALVGFFPTDEETIYYLEQTGRDRQKIGCIKEYMSKVKILRKSDSQEPEYSSVIEIDLSEVQPCLSGPKRSRDKVHVSSLPQDFRNCLTEREGPKGYGLPPEQVHTTFSVNVDGAFHQISHGSVLLAAITSCSNSSNPSVMLGAGLLAKKAIEAGLSVAKYIRTSLAPGSGIVTTYLQESGVMPYFHMLGFEIVGYGCKSCSENYKSLPQSIVDAMKVGNLVCCGVLSGNRNFEGRLSKDIKANYLASPMLVIAYAIAGRVDIDFTHMPIGFNSKEEPIMLADIWPSRKEIQNAEKNFVIPALFRQVHPKITYGNKHWSSLKTAESNTFDWNMESSFIQPPLYVTELSEDLESSFEDKLQNMRCLLKLGDNVTSDQISPAGSIARNSPAADYLSSLGLAPREYNSYGARRGNCQVMIRGTFAHVKLKNQLSSKTGPYTVHLPSEVPTSIYDAAQRYKAEKVPLYIIAGENFGRGASRDWATKGPMLLGVRAIMALSFDPAYRANLIRSGILPVEIDTTTYEILTGREKLHLVLPNLRSKSAYTNKIVKVVMNGDFDLNAKHGLANSYEGSLFADGGVMRQMLRQHIKNSKKDKSFPLNCIQNNYS